MFFNATVREDEECMLREHALHALSSVREGQRSKILHSLLHRLNSGASENQKITPAGTEAATATAGSGRPKRKRQPPPKLRADEPNSSAEE